MACRHACCGIGEEDVRGYRGSLEREIEGEEVERDSSCGGEVVAEACDGGKGEGEVGDAMFCEGGAAARASLPASLKQCGWRHARLLASSPSPRRP